MEKEIKVLISSIEKQAQQVNLIFEEEVGEIIFEKSVDATRIEALLDKMLGFCLNEEILMTYKKLLRYYYYIDEKATEFYINAYREVWDDDE